MKTAAEMKDEISRLEALLTSGQYDGTDEYDCIMSAKDALCWAVGFYGDKVSDKY